MSPLPLAHTSLGLGLRRSSSLAFPAPPPTSPPLTTPARTHTHATTIPPPLRLQDATPAADLTLAYATAISAEASGAGSFGTVAATFDFGNMGDDSVGLLQLCYKFGYHAAPPELAVEPTPFIRFPAIQVAVVRYEAVMPRGTAIGCSSNLTVTGLGFDALSFGTASFEVSGWVPEPDPLDPAAISINGTNSTNATDATNASSLVGTVADGPYEGEVLSYQREQGCEDDPTYADPFPCSSWAKAGQPNCSEGGAYGANVELLLISCPQSCADGVPVCSSPPPPPPPASPILSCSFGDLGSYPAVVVNDTTITCPTAIPSEVGLLPIRIEYDGYYMQSMTQAHQPAFPSFAVYDALESRVDIVTPQGGAYNLPG